MSRTRWRIGKRQPAASGWQTLKLGAGGFITGGDIASDGTMVGRTDTYGAYRYDTSTSKWVQLVTQNSIPSGDWYIDFGDRGVWEIRIAPSDTSVFYMIWNGYVYKSTDSGATWVRKALTQMDPDSVAYPNGAYKFIGGKLAIDPNDPAKVIVAVPGGRPWRTSDSGANWTEITDITAATTSDGPGTVLYYDSSTVYVANYGRGVWKSTNAGVNFSAMTGGPTMVNNWVHDSAGNLYACAYPVTGNNFYKCTSAGTWSNITAVSQSRQAVVVDPADDTRIITFGDGTTPSDQSFDSGATWTGPYQRLYPASPTVVLESSSDVPWHETWYDNDTSGYLSCGNVIWNAHDNRIYDFWGNGVQWCTHPTTYDATASSVLTWNGISKGIEQLVVNRIRTISGVSGVFVACWDRPIFHLTDLASYPSVYYPYYQPLTHCWDLDYAKNDANFLAATISYGTPTPSYSTDAGATWTAVSTPTSQLGGSIAVSTSTNWVLLPGEGHGPYYTTNGGSSWTACGDVPSGGGWSFSWLQFKHAVTADCVTLNKFYCYDYTTGVWVSTNSGANWTNTVGPFADSGFNVQLESVPGHAGHVVYTSGPNGVPSASNPANQLAYLSTNSGTSFSSIPNLKEITRFGFGKQIGAGYDPTVFCVGWYDDGGGYDYGIWYSTNFGDATPTWTLIGTNVLDSFDQITSISGDMNTARRCYIGFRGSGGAWIDF